MDRGQRLPPGGTDYELVDADWAPIIKIKGRAGDLDEEKGCVASESLGTLQTPVFMWCCSVLPAHLDLESPWLRAQAAFVLISASG